MSNLSNLSNLYNIVRDAPQWDEKLGVVLYPLGAKIKRADNWHEQINRVRNIVMAETAPRTPKKRTRVDPPAAPARAAPVARAPGIGRNLSAAFEHADAPSTPKRVCRERECPPGPGGWCGPLRFNPN